ncbi:DUF6302 family protein [Streptomyces olivaceus]|uniref:DUF6302 family protein n=2 Tax=Streptomyces olivaceus TaxID=47716 RepID=UPI0036C3AB47
MPSQAEPDVTVMPPAKAYDFDYFRCRVDAGLLSRSIAVRVFRIPLLAVPVGGSRRGGWFGAGDLAGALAVRQVLAALNGFPCARHVAAHPELFLRGRVGGPSSGHVARRQRAPGLLRPHVARPRPRPPPPLPRIRCLQRFLQHGLSVQLRPSLKGAGRAHSWIKESPQASQNCHGDDRGTDSWHSPARRGGSDERANRGGRPSQ